MECTGDYIHTYLLFEVYRETYTYQEWHHAGGKLSLEIAILWMAFVDSRR